MTVDYFRKLFGYNYWAHRQVWDCVLKLDEAQYHQPSTYSVGSVHAQVVHTYAVELFWLGRVQQIPDPQFPEASAFADRSALRTAWDALESEWCSLVDGLTDGQLNERISYMSIVGRQRRVTPLWQALTQVLNHGTDHRAQTLWLIHQVGGETVAQDFIFYSWE